MPPAAREHHRRPAHSADLPVGSLLVSLASRSDLPGCRTRQIICQTDQYRRLGIANGWAGGARGYALARTQLLRRTT